jgi:hypothetical protein
LNVSGWAFTASSIGAAIAAGLHHRADIGVGALQADLVGAQGLHRRFERTRARGGGVGRLRSGLAGIVKADAHPRLVRRQIQFRPPRHAHHGRIIGLDRRGHLGGGRQA